MNIVDYLKKITEGSMYTEKDFYLKLMIPKIKKIIKEYDLHYNKESIIVNDDNLANRVFEAAIELIAEVGIYCENTNRVISFDKSEVIEGLEMPYNDSIFGEGKDRNRMAPRKPGENTLPWFHVGTGIVASSEDIAQSVVEGYGSIEDASSISIPAFSQIRGIDVPGGSPFEIIASVNSVQAGRKALKTIGRPGLPILNLNSSATTSVGTVASSYPEFGLRKSDGWLVDFLAEMKINFESLNRLMFVSMIGGNIGSTALPILGGYSGGAVGTALVMTAYYILGKVFFNGSYHLSGPLHFSFGNSSTRDALWIFNIVGRATSLNMEYPMIGLGYAAFGPCTKEYFYEAAAIALSIVNSGYAAIQTVHPAKAVVNDGVTPLEARFLVDFSKAIVGISSEESNKIVLKLLERYEQKINEASPGKKYYECYDVTKREPTGEYLKIYENIVKEFSQMGIVL